MVRMERIKPINLVKIKTEDYLSQHSNQTGEVSE